jgi:hypothetical protein
MPEERCRVAGVGEEILARRQDTAAGRDLRESVEGASGEQADPLATPDDEPIHVRHPTFADMRMPKIMTTAAVFLLASVACSQRVATEEEYAARERERPLLPASAAPAALVTGSGGPAEAMPRGPAEIVGRTGAAPNSAGPGIRGTVEAPGLETPSPGAVLFVFVRAADRTAGPPLAVQRLSPSALPMAYSIGPADAMLGPEPFPDLVVVEARLDADGDPLSRDPGDLSARSDPVAPGSEGVTLTLVAGGD